METQEIYKIEKAVTTYETIELRLPHFTKSPCHVNKVINKDECIHVCFGKYVNPSIQITGASMAFNTNTEECTEEEFNKHFNETLQYLTLKAL